MTQQMFTIFKKSDKYTTDMWERHEVEIDAAYGMLTANEIGEHLGAGEFYYWESVKKYAGISHIKVAAITRYEEAPEVPEWVDAEEEALA